MSVFLLRESSGDLIFPMVGFVLVVVLASWEVLKIFDRR